MDAKTRGEIEKQAELYETAKRTIKKKIVDGIRVAIEKLEATERELLEEVEAEFGENPFFEFLGVENHTEDEAKNILRREIPQAFGPDEGSFESLRKDIESFKEWRKKPDQAHLVPNGVTLKEASWDKISLSWNAVEGAKFYLVEADDEIFWAPGTSNTFTKADLLPDTEHSFRVRAVRGNKMSEWSGAAKGRTKRSCAWKECPDYVANNLKYSVDGNNPRVATKIGDCYGCTTITGSASLTPNTVTSWSVKVLKSKNNDGFGIFVGVAPFDINQNSDNRKCGWYFRCYSSNVCSGPPHNIGRKDYGPRKEKGQCVRTGDTVGVVMDTARGELSFVLNGVNHGVAYEGIPLDKPLVPCALLWHQRDSVELVI